MCVEKNSEEEEKEEDAVMEWELKLNWDANFVKRV